MLTQESSATILYIEDDPASKAMIKMLLNPYPGIQLMTAWTAEEGIGLATTHHPDLIFIDINLPCMDGTMALTRLKTIPELENTPMIAISANAMPEQIEKSLALGFDKYLTKPVDLNDILAAIAAVS